MSTENPNPKNAPVYTHRDGSIFAKIWENQSTDGRAYHTVTFGKTYTDSNGNPRETQGFSGVDVLKVQQLAQEAYRTMQQARQMQIAEERNAEQQQQGLQAQRNAAMTNAAPTGGNGVAAPTQYQAHQSNQTPSQ